MIQTVLVLATSFLDDPVTAHPNAGAARRLLDTAAAESAGRWRVIYRCDRSPLTPLTTEELAGVTAVIADLERYPADLLHTVGPAGGGDLRIICRYGVGTDAVDIQAASDAGILVTNTPGCNSLPTAEWAVATLLDVAGRRAVHHERASAGQGKVGPARLDLTDKRLGVVGTGQIGRHVVSLLSGFKMKICAYDVYPDHDWAKEHSVQYVSMEELIDGSDFITLHAASKHEIIGPAQIARFRSDTVLINCARGVLVDNRAVYHAVKEGRMYGYGIDEIWIESDLPLSGMNIITSPHVGSDSDSGKINMQMATARQVAAFIAGQTPANLLNAEILPLR
jgi:D-3-phosphoglycerate dehydrogenase / 2-oxoglutarate reductase